MNTEIRRSPFDELLYEAQHLPSIPKPMACMGLL